MIPYVTREPTGGEWRVGRHYGIHVYEGDRPVATFHDPADAERAVTAVNSWRRVTTGDPTEPEPLAMQARTLLVRWRELEATVARVRELAKEANSRLDWHIMTIGPGGSERRYVPLDRLHRALDGEPQP